MIRPAGNLGKAQPDREWSADCTTACTGNRIVNALLLWREFVGQKMGDSGHRVSSSSRTGCPEDPSLCPWYTCWDDPLSHQGLTLSRYPKHFGTGITL